MKQGYFVHCIYMYMYMYTMCVCTQCVYVYIQCVLQHCMGIATILLEAVISVLTVT